MEPTSWWIMTRHRTYMQMQIFFAKSKRYTRWYLRVLDLVEQEYIHYNLQAIMILRKVHILPFL